MEALGQTGSVGAVFKLCGGRGPAGDRSGLTAAVCGALLVTGLAGSAPADAAKPRKRTKKETGPKVTYANGQNADQYQRAEDARLTRECRGRPNAGACAGYAR